MDAESNVIDIIDDSQLDQESRLMDIPLPLDEVMFIALQLLCYDYESYGSKFL